MNAEFIGRRWGRKMGLQEEIQLSLTVLITGLVVVFAMLVFLTLVIKGYGSAVHSIQSRLNGKPDRGQAVPGGLPEFAPEAEAPEAAIAAVDALEPEEGEIPGEVLAAISAAVSCMFPQGSVTAVRRSAPAGRGRSPWGMAGLLENTRPF